MAGLKGKSSVSKLEILCFKCYYIKKYDSSELHFCSKSMRTIFTNRQKKHCKNFIEKDSKKSNDIHNERIKKALQYLNKLNK